MLFKKTRRQYEDLIKDQDERIEELEKALDRAYSTLTTFEVLEDGTPNDCTRGIWCRSCEFRKVLHIPRRTDNGFNLSGYHTVYFCGKGEVCSNFVQREVKNNE